MDNREFDVASVVNRLVGPVEPIGETSADEKRYKNLLHLIDVVDDLVGQLRRIERYADRPEYSIGKIGLRARSFLSELIQSGD